MTRPSIWDDEANVHKLRKLWHDPKLSLTDIANLFGLTREAVKNRAQRDGLPRKPKISPEMRAEWCPQQRIDDAEHVAKLNAAGGFLAHEEERYAHRGYLLGFGPDARRINADFYRCLPLKIDPARAA